MIININIYNYKNTFYLMTVYVLVWGLHLARLRGDRGF